MAIRMPIGERIAKLEEHRGDVDRRLDECEKKIDDVLLAVERITTKLALYAGLGSVAGGGIVTLIVLLVLGHLQHPTSH